MQASWLVMCGMCQWLKACDGWKFLRCYYFFLPNLGACVWRRDDVWSTSHMSDRPNEHFGSFVLLMFSFSYFVACLYSFLFSRCDAAPATPTLVLVSLLGWPALGSPALPPSLGWVRVCGDLLVGSLLSHKTVSQPEWNNKFAVDMLNWQCCPRPPLECRFI